LIKKDNIKIKLDWHPDKYVSVSQYENMVKHYVQNYIKRENDAEYIRPKEFPY
tara:strand:- start:230 stop:388 length:159 start_codon:yes stop_codon:yes gene_type:complete